MPSSETNTLPTHCKRLWNEAAVQLLTLFLGDNAYQSYDDSDFQSQYDALCAESNLAMYEVLAKLLYGMNRSQIDYETAQGLVTSGSQEDAVLVGFKALLLHPESFDTSKLDTDQDESLRTRAKAEDLGLSAVADAGIAWAQWLKGESSFIVEDWDSSWHYSKLAAAQGNTSALSNLGDLYENGLGVERDYAKAKYYYELAAAQGHANAQYNLGILYLIGLGVERDYAKALECYELAAAQGCPVAQLRLEQMREEK